jgi:hypothetical protein
MKKLIAIIGVAFMLLGCSEDTPPNEACNCISSVYFHRSYFCYPNGYQQTCWRYEFSHSEPASCQTPKRIDFNGGYTLITCN